MVDWMYDRPETAINILGDSLGAVAVTANATGDTNDKFPSMDVGSISDNGKTTLLANGSFRNTFEQRKGRMSK